MFVHHVVKFVLAAATDCQLCPEEALAVRGSIHPSSLHALMLLILLVSGFLRRDLTEEVTCRVTIVISLQSADIHYGLHESLFEL